MNNEPNSTSTGLPPVIGGPPSAAPAPLSANAGPRDVVESLFKRPLAIIGSARTPERGRLLFWLVVVIIISAAAYGLVMGTFSCGRQLWVAPVKVVICITGSALFCLPGLYMAACLSGRDVTLAEVTGYLLAGVALSTLLLVGFAPAAWLFSVSTNSAAFMGALHLGIWLVGTAAALHLLGRAFGNGGVLWRGHMVMWCLMFVLVCLQLTTTLRPLLGTADEFLPTEKKFFMVHWWDCLEGK